MNIRVTFYFFILLIIQTGCNETKKEERKPSATVLKGATLFDGAGNKLENSVVIVKDGKIEDIGSENIAIPEDAEVNNISGKFITPGIVDAHVHFFQTGFFDARPDVLDLRDSLSYSNVITYQRYNPERYYEAYLRSGVTAVYDVGGMPWSIQLQQSAEKDLKAPHVAASGPLITPVPEEYISIFNYPVEKVMVHLGSGSIGRDVVAYCSDLGSTGIKIWGMRPEDEEFMENVRAVADEVEKRGNKLIVHATTLPQAKAALEIGAKLLVHSVSDQAVDDEFIRLAKENNVVYTPTMVVSLGYYHAYKAVLGEEMKIEDPNSVVDEKTLRLIEGAKRYSSLVDTIQLKSRIENAVRRIRAGDSIMAINVKKLYEEGILIAMGTDAGNPGTLHGISVFDEMEKMQDTGIPADQLIIMATRNGAIAMERIDDFGTLEKGKMADLIILEEDPSIDIKNMRTISHFMRGGLLRPVEEDFR